MTTAARKLIVECAKAGKDQQTIQAELISHGFGTEGFAETYAEVLDELGIEAPPEPTPTAPFNPMVNTNTAQFATPKTLFDREQMLFNGLRIVAGLLVIAAVAIAFSGIGQRLIETYFGEGSSENNLSASDVVLRGKIKTLQESAELYRNRLLDYEGLCRSIGIDPTELNCQNNTEAYVISGELSNGQFYCVDSTDFAGVVPRVSNRTLSCQ